MDQPNEGPVPQTPAASQDRIGYEPTGDEAELIRLSCLWMETAQRLRDDVVLEALHQIMAPDFTLQVWDAQRTALPLDF